MKAAIHFVPVCNFVVDDTNLKLVELLTQENLNSPNYNCLLSKNWRNFDS